ncbi:hypothetical protein D3C75_327460 [compost metagenome]
MSETTIDSLLRGVHFIAMIRSIDPIQVAENVRLSMEDLKVDTAHLDQLVTPRMTVRQLQAIPNFDKDRQIVEDILSCYLADVMIDAMTQSGMDPRGIPLQGILSATLLIEPVQQAALKLLIPLH